MYFVDSYLKWKGLSTYNLEMIMMVSSCLWEQERYVTWSVCVMTSSQWGVDRSWDYGTRTHCLLCSHLCTQQHHTALHWNTAAAAHSTRKCFIKIKMFAEYLHCECPTAAIVGESVKVCMLYQAINFIIISLRQCHPVTRGEVKMLWKCFNNIRFSWQKS